ncbi:uncharacterized protein LOC121726342 isoform X1 [Aricia agestis]|uniref:uncharacterized protein LOC121726342 isoform X1 n=1 Tax=Aricia agestis TaxID=91739 RepID=UPI001C203BC0|nr:uncharacterized protein LOC121726342 isoform X1 [Aricia agestis]
MEQMYLIEILIDRVKVFAKEIEHSEDKKLIIKTKFGPKVEFIIKEGQLAKNPDEKDEVFEENGIKKWARSIRVGKSYLFPSYPDTILMILNKFPLEIEVWTDDKKEDSNEFIGIGTMYWDNNFFHMLKANTDPCRIYEPLTLKQSTTLNAECCCREVGEIEFILRLSALGESIITEFQQLMKEPDNFVFRTNKAPGMFKCNQVDGNDPNFCMVGSLYETTTLNNPVYKNESQEKILACTNVDSCKHSHTHVESKSKSVDKKQIKKYPIDKIRMGDITGPCGNTSCPLAHKVKRYIRNLDTYKNATKGFIGGTKPVDPTKVCGSCVCKDDREHRMDCPDKQMQGKQSNKALCLNCGGITHAGETCAELKGKMYGTGATPKGSKNLMTYVLHTHKNNDFKECMYDKQYVSRQFDTDVNSSDSCSSSSNSHDLHKSLDDITIQQANLGNALNHPNLYDFKISESKRKFAILNCYEVSVSKDCKCSASEEVHKKTCKAADCKCLAKARSLASRKAHKPYCPSYKHKDNCPVTTMLHEENETNENEEEENHTEPLPYGLPPITLGPCPVIGRPCTVPDGFARMYKAAAVPSLPPSYSEAGKVCCSKEFERIKKALNDYMAPEKTQDLRCVKEFNADTDRRCCDKEQTLMSLTGKDCCGAHKLAIQEKYKRTQNGTN